MLSAIDKKIIPTCSPNKGSRTEDSIDRKLMQKADLGSDVDKDVLAHLKGSLDVAEGMPFTRASQLLSWLLTC